LCLCSQLTALKYFIDLGASIDSFPHVLEVPDEAEIKTLRSKLEALRQLKIDRISQIEGSRKVAQELMELLSPIEEPIDMELVQAEHVRPTEFNVGQLNETAAKLASIREKRKEIIATAMFKLEGPEGLWSRVDVPEQHQKLVKSDLRLKASTIDRLQAEIERCQELDKRNELLPALITSLRVDILAMLELCKKITEESVANEVLEYNETTLKLHEMELEELHSFYDQNQNTFELLNERDDLKVKITELMSKAVDARSRLKNRGGHLLKEEQERKALERKLLKAEVDLVAAAKNFEKINRGPLLIFGNPIELDVTAENRLQLKKQASSTSLLRLKKPLGNASNL
jgi:Microtubule associated protein (MAP65/ASE1 family)